MDLLSFASQVRAFLLGKRHLVTAQVNIPQPPSLSHSSDLIFVDLSSDHENEFPIE